MGEQPWYRRMITERPAAIGIVAVAGLATYYYVYLPNKGSMKGRENPSEKSFKEGLDDYTMSKFPSKRTDNHPPKD
eukprot:CAMPEP_0184696106 /NCGR_PEP_ID=MMETSP0313-20130426/3512_1 /TAXON_ID=2792 /ORGANISM="Porphyridium aerugineum, Strain SAG 1380-2" /LENGTH=75 /DNA_ID=CAMNT_0027154671 /DNA_START=86 /DNA_END=313 /DNA_ORIENTATION=+